jgi:ketosteroid isomerase-like protein
MTDAQLATRIRRLEDRVEIDELIARYGLVMDDRDMRGMPDLFTADAVVRSLDGVMNCRGREALIDLYRGRFKVLGPSNHFTHDRIVTFDDANPDLARGLVLAQAELNRRGPPLGAAIRYTDTYRREAERWKFAERVLAFMYYVPTAEYLDAFGPGLATRNRAYETPGPADWPEPLPTWREYYGS